MPRLWLRSIFTFVFAFFRIIVLALGFAYKGLNDCDQPSINDKMAQLLGLPKLQVNLIERTLFAALDYNVHMPAEEVTNKKEMLYKQISVAAVSP